MYAAAVVPKVFIVRDDDDKSRREPAKKYTAGSPRAPHLKSSTHLIPRSSSLSMSSSPTHHTGANSLFDMELSLSPAELSREMAVSALRSHPVDVQ
ncbi:hypothetical protein ACKKBG_A20730 [Auxenochlorella protothecoides x Auxenochlorella symbiontica]